ncbi:sulfur oxidation c-type cytochrome SoxX [Methylobacterium sp. C25]|uniref:sulfur oxidation c-type cytochrome SoxX n=1 Tax=Methylobacterium sp. C25 TaxID=2721622 RepID=UPI001F389ABD|nr:sulfur oxidation c-type cytochrome SoxX [Methylobacterium sp. C25]MCE4226485.1 sulfur oxidation c-type cytochrome SoxX [Methylobacterium sp. C25]
MHRHPFTALLTAALVLVQTGTVLAQGDAAEGKAIAFDRGRGNCLSCHAIPGGDLPGNIGPSLAGLKERYPNREDVVAIIRDETLRNPETVMPPFGRNLLLTDREIRSVVEYLYSH